jgi:hypothetical protein
MQVERTLSGVSGGRVSNTWITCLTDGDNRPKGLLIPGKLTGPHGSERRGAARRCGERGPRPIS